MHPSPSGGGLALPARIGNYRIEERLGAGGMGVVYRAFDESLQRPLAIKHLLPDRTDPNASLRFRREARMAARLNHPAIVHIYDIVETDDGDWIAMELIEGQTLDRAIREGGLDLPQAVQLGREIAEGLAEAHARGIIHRDLKASNTMVTSAGHAKILDFGLAKLIHQESESDLSHTGAVLGTYHAMSPEQVQGLPLSHASDLFSLGSLLYEMASGVSPFRAATVTETLARICTLEPLPIAQIRPEVPWELSNLLDCLLRKEPRQRPQSTREVARALGLIEQALPSAAARGRGPARPGRSEASQDAALQQTTRVDGAAIGSDPGSSPDPSSRPASERRQVTVVCCELSPGDPPMEGSDPAGVYELLLQLRALAAAAANRYGGCLGKAQGHRILIYFGYPQAYEDSARRAVRAALELAAQIATLKAGGDPPVPLALRTGIHTGLAVVATHPESPEPVTLGAALDLAVGLRSLAGPGDVIVSPVTSALIQKSFTLEPLAPVRLPRLDALVAPQRVVGLLEQPGDSAVGLTSLVGRERELELLTSRWNLACEGTGQAALISGEPGIGKSRLTLGLREQLGESAALWLTCYGSPDAQSSPLQPLVVLLRRVLASQEGDAPLDRLETLLQRLGMIEAAPLLASLLDLPLADRYPAPRLSPDRQREKTLEALLGLVTEMAERQPLVLLVEDLHWLDPTTLGWLDRLIDQAATVPLFLVMTLRLHTLESLWGPRPHLTQITLSPLSEAEAGRLVDRVAGERRLPPEVRRQIVDRTDGVPLFLEELTRAGLEAHESGERWDLPYTLRDSLSARLDRLGTAREIAQLASVIGRAFPLELLAAVAPRDEPALHQDLRRLVQAGLLYRKGFGDKARYFFKHALIQDAAYDSLPLEERQELHLQIAEALEAGFPEAADAQPELLARHYSEAGLAATAVDYWSRAAQKAFRRSAPQEAMAHCQSGLALIAALPEGAERDRRELGLHSVLGPVLCATRGYGAPEVERAYARAYELCTRMEDAPQLFWVLWGLWAFYAVYANYTKAVDLGRQLLRLAESAGDQALRYESHYALGVTFFFMGRFREAAHHLDSALECDSPGRDRSALFLTGQDVEVVTRTHKAINLWFLGYPDQAAAAGDEAIALGRRLAHPFSLAIALSNSGTWLRQLLRQPEAVRALAEESLVVCQEEGLFWGNIAQILLGWAEARGAGDASPEEGLRRMHRGLDAYAGSGCRMGLPLYYNLIADACLRLRRVEDGERALARGLEAVGSTGERSWEAELLRLQGELALAGMEAGGPDRSAEAAACFRRAIAAARELGAPACELRAATSLGRLALAQGRRDEARELVAGVHGRFTEGFATADLVDAEALIRSASA